MNGHLRRLRMSGDDTIADIKWPQDSAKRIKMAGTVTVIAAPNSANEALGGPPP
jgi:hypothetical protein